MAWLRERNSSGNNVTSGVGFDSWPPWWPLSVGFITRSQALTSLTSAADFLLNKAGTVKALSHWLDGTTGAIIPFSQKEISDRL